MGFVWVGIVAPCAEAFKFQVNLRCLRVRAAATEQIEMGSFASTHIFSGGVVRERVAETWQLGGFDVIITGAFSPAWGTIPQNPALPFELMKANVKLRLLNNAWQLSLAQIQFMQSQIDAGEDAWRPTKAVS